MAFTLTERALNESLKLKIEPQLVLEIEGVTTLFGAVEIMRVIRIGDPLLYIGSAWTIGGLTPIDDQESIISLDGSSSKIEQLLYPDKGSVSSVSSVQLSLIDSNTVMTQLISPGVVITDILGVKATLWVGYKNTAFKEDYIPVFSGIIDDVESGSGMVKLNIAHPEQLKRQMIFSPVSVELTGSINDSVTTIPLVSSTGLPNYVLGPDGSQDTAITFFVKIEDEFISYAGISGNSLTGCVRGELASLPASHTAGADPVTAISCVQIEDLAMNCALKIMLSGVNGAYATAVPAERFNHPTVITTLANSVFFQDIDLSRDYGLAVGDYMTITGATNGANNVTAKVVTDIVSTDDGSYAVLASVSFVSETGSSAIVSFRSQYDTLGYGLGMSPDQVDVNEHVFWNNYRLAAHQYRFVIQKEINGKDFLDKEVYLPVGAFSLPRQGRCSMGYHVGPIIRGSMPTLSRDNIKNPDKIRLRRTLNSNFYNSVTYRFDKRESDESFASGTVTTDTDSQTQIAVGNKVFSIISSGMRRNLDGTGIAERIAARYLGRYKYAAEFIENISILFKDGMTIEPGDVVLLDPAEMQISNTADGTRDKPAKIFEVINKRLDLKTGEVSLSITDTNFDGSERYGSVAPSSNIVSGTTTSLIIEDSYGALFPGNESRKWEDYLGLPIIVHSVDWSFEEEVTLLSIDPSNAYKLNLDTATPLSVAPTAGYVIEIGNYPTTALTSDNDRYKAAHAFVSASVAVTSGIDALSFHVAAPDITLFTVGSMVRVHNADYTNDSGEVMISASSGTTVTVATTLGFTPDTTHTADSMDFADGGNAYRIF